jgi:hypothetical protein
MARQPSGVNSEPVLYRDEALGLTLAVHDILEEVRRICTFLEDEDGEEEEEVDLGE